MPNKMERFSQPARYVLSRAQELAENFKSREINIVHVLLGMTMTRSENTDAFNTLHDYDIIEAKLSPFIKSKKTSFMPEADGDVTFLDLSDDVKRMLEFSIDTARRKGHLHIATGHLLIGLMRLESEIIDEILAHFDVQKKDITKRAEYYFDDAESSEQQMMKKQIEQQFTDALAGRKGCAGEIMNLLGFNGKRKNDE